MYNRMCAATPATEYAKFNYVYSERRSTYAVCVRCEYTNVWRSCTLPKCNVVTVLYVIQTVEYINKREREWEICWIVENIFHCAPHYSLWALLRRTVAYVGKVPKFFVLFCFFFARFKSCVDTGTALNAFRLCLQIQTGSNESECVCFMHFVYSCI